MNAHARIKPTYPTKAKIRHAVQTARELGLDVAGYEVSPDGSIRVFDARTAQPQPELDYDRMKREGLI